MSDFSIQKFEEATLPPAKNCPECGKVNLPALPECWNCGHKFFEVGKYV